MYKFLSIIIWEYVRITYNWTFLLSTFLAPVLLIVLTVGPLFFYSTKDNTLRIAVGNFSESDFQKLQQQNSGGNKSKNYPSQNEDINFSNNQKGLKNNTLLNIKPVFIKVEPENNSVNQTKKILNERLVKEEIDGYIIASENADSVKNGEFIYFTRNTGDSLSHEIIRNLLQETVLRSRAESLGINQNNLNYLNDEIQMKIVGINKEGLEKEKNVSYSVALIISLLIYISLTLYGQAIIGKIVEEKQTRIVEILFSSVNSFQLIAGKLFGVGLASLTQFAVWVISVVILNVYGIYQANMLGMNVQLPNIGLLTLFYFFIFFILGFFVYASIFAFIGSIVSTVQEGTQFSFIPIGFLIFGIYSVFSVIRDPNSDFSIILSILPFTSSIVMPVRLLAEQPPFWQIFLAFIFNIAFILIALYIIAKIYRIGMLIYGKRPTLPEIWKWILHS